MTKEACKNSRQNPDIWFPTGNRESNNTQLAISICVQCPIRVACAKAVLKSLGSQYPIKSGIWAGVRLADSHAHGLSLKQRYDQLRVIAGQEEPS